MESRVQRNWSALKSEVWYETTRSGGAGGQHVNRTESAVILRWLPAFSELFTPLEKQRILANLAAKINLEGELYVRSEKFRDQLSNKEEAFEILKELLTKALFVQKPRKKTRPTKSSVRQRLNEKKHHSQTKQLRSKKFDDA